MAAVTTELKVLVKAVGKGELKELEAALNKLAVTARTKVDVNFKKVSAELKKIQSTSTTSIKNLRDYRNAWRDIAAQLDISSKEFKEATAEAAKLDAQLAKAEKRKPAGRGGRLKGLAQGAGTIAAGGIFGGPEGALGATIGLATGGVAGAAVGAALGAQVSSLRKLVGETAAYVAEVDKLKIALQNVVGLEYDESLLIISNASNDFNFSLKDTTRTFTQLAAAGTANGASVKQLEVLYRGLSAATKATGGSTEDLKGVLLAATQVLSKGKVSAEELRGQIGERLPGAFSLFAEATGRTTQQLDKDLKDGAVSAEEFVNEFANYINTKYKDAAAQIADSPAEAGARLEVALQNLNVALGPIFADLGAQFQQFAIDGIKSLEPLINKLNEVFRVDRKGKNERLYELEGGGVSGVGQIEQIRSEINRLVSEGDGGAFETERIKGVGQFIGSQSDAFNFLGKALVRAEAKAAQLRLELYPTARKEVDLPTGRTTIEDEGKPKGRSGGRGGRGREPMGQAEFDIRQRIDEADRENLETRKLLAELDLKRFLILKKTVDDPLKRRNNLQIAETKFEKDLLKIGAKREEQAKKETKLKMDQVREGFKIGKQVDDLIPKTTELQDLWESIGDNIASGVGKALEDVIFNAKSLSESLSGILKSLASMFLQLGTKSLIGMIPGFADGGVMSQSGPMDLKRYARGGIANSPQLAMFGEGSTPEAYVPLPDGRSIPVTMRGGGAGNIVVNVDAKGTQVEGDEGQSKQLGSAISAAVQAELIKQQRPGGLLSR